MTNIVIGAGSGMGAAIARKIAPQGPLLVADCNAEPVQRLASELGGGAKAAQCDISDVAQIDASFAGVREIGALIVTAGLSGTMAPGKRILEVNLLGYERVLKRAQPLLTRGGAVILFSSQSGYQTPELPELCQVIDDPLASDFFDKLGAVFDVSDSSASYSLSKRGVHRMTKRWAKRLGEKGVRILSVSPGINDTPMNRADEAAYPVMQKIIEASALGRRGTTDEIANLTAFLISDGASIMTGCDVLADCGMNAMFAFDFPELGQPPRE